MTFAERLENLIEAELNNYASQDSTDTILAALEQQVMALRGSARRDFDLNGQDRW